MRISNSKIKTYRRCPKQYEYKYVRRLEPKTKSLPLTRGDWLHQMLMNHYDHGDWRPIHADLSKRFLTLFVEEREELGDLPGETARIMRSYTRRWKKRDSQLHVVDSELDEILTLPNGDEFNFIIDLIVEEPDGGLWLWDHKTVKDFLPADFQLIDAQLSRYFWAAEKMGYVPLRGVMFNEIRTKPPAIPNVLKSGALSQRKNMDTDYFTYLAEIRKHGLDPLDYADTLRRLRANTGRFFRRTKLPRDRPMTRQQMLEMIWTADEIKTAERRSRFPRTPMKSCQWDCSFADLCVVELHGGDSSSIEKMHFTERTRS